MITSIKPTRYEPSTILDSVDCYGYDYFYNGRILAQGAAFHGSSDDDSNMGIKGDTRRSIKV